jgi:hypothetical protein
MPEPQGFYTDKNGVVRPITKRRTTGAVVAGAIVVGLMTAAGGGGATASVGAALDSATSASADAETSSSEDAARKGNDTDAWQRMALKELKKTIKKRLRCGLQSTRQVRQFFLRTPCESLDQLLFALEDTRGNLIVVSVVWVKMSSEDDATQLKTLEDTYGTGDIIPIATQVLQLGGIRFTGAHYTSRQDGSLVVVSEAESARGRASTVVLNDATRIAAVLPPP